MKILHFKCRNAIYPRSGINRAFVPDDKVSWSVDWTDYRPIYYTATDVRDVPMSDPELTKVGFNPCWNKLDNGVDRRSFLGEYRVVNGFPLNPIGRTGLTGRGILKRWGPNHAADPIVTKWKRDELGRVLTDQKSGKNILQVILIKRGGSGEWAIPGGMVDPGEDVSVTLKREFLEEALSFLDKTQEEKSKLEEQVRPLFSKGDFIYQGYVDGARNTDNAWMETFAMNYHDDSGKFTDSLSLKAGDDAADVFWGDLSHDRPLCANHGSLLELVALYHNAFW